MIPKLRSKGLGSACFLACWSAASTVWSADETPTQFAHSAAPPWKLLFSDSQDVADVWGKLHFGVTPVRHLRQSKSRGITFVGGFPQSDGMWEAFGQEIVELQAGDETSRVVVWRLVRGATRDGAHFENMETVFESAPGAWTNHLAVARNGDTSEYLLLKLKVDDNGFAYTAFFSQDGKQWQEHDANPLFYDGDAMSLFWSPPLGRFVCINKSFQPFRKRLRDHGGPTPDLKDDALRDRRVLMTRTSADGRRWEPSVSLSDVWNRNGRKGAIPVGYTHTPDADDPPDLEFYSGNGFWYHDRAYMLVLNYAASPLKPRQLASP